jgi:hypothetical protein
MLGLILDVYLEIVMKEIARLVVDGWPSPRLATLEKWLYQSIKKLKTDKRRIKFLITPGGFSLGKFPKDWNGSRGWETEKEALSELIPYAIPVVNQVISKRVLKAAKNVVQYITLNVDLRAASTPLHAELITLIDVATGKSLGWTGKSYPTMNQENKLVHVTDLASHLFKVGLDRVIILGCHDLNVYSGRARANQKVGGARYKRSRQMLEHFKRFNPTHIIQHPHGTDTWRSWNGTWKQVSAQHPDACWASAIGYAANNGKRRAPLQDVLERTHHEGPNSLNVIVKGRKKRTMLQRQYVPPIAALNR